MHLALDAVDWDAVARMRAEGRRRFPDTRLLDLERLPDELALPASGRVAATLVTSYNFV